MASTANIILAAGGGTAATASLAVTLRQWRSWPPLDRITTAALAIAVWPWVIAGLIITPPMWWTISAGVIALAAAVAFIYSQVAFLRSARTAQREFDRLRATLLDDR
jgi:hypothetical protein